MDVKIKFVGKVPYPSYAPTKRGDAGLDLRSQEEIIIAPGDVASVPTGICIAIPEHLVGMVCSRSGMALKQQVAVLGDPGIIDSGYRGEIRVTLMNHGKEPVVIAEGDRVAQLLLINHMMSVTTFIPVDELDETERGVEGFGSTGKE